MGQTLTYLTELAVGLGAVFAFRGRGKGDAENVVRGAAREARGPATSS